MPSPDGHIRKIQRLIKNTVGIGKELYRQQYPVSHKFVIISKTTIGSAARSTGYRTIPQMSGDIDTSIRQERDAFVLQHQSLQAFLPSPERIVMAQRPILVYNPVARQTATAGNIRHDTADDTGGAGATREQSDQAIGSHTPRRDLAD